MDITLNIPALDRFCDLIENHGGFAAISPATTQVVDEPAPEEKPKAAKKAAKKAPKEKPEKEEPEVTVDDVVKVGKAYVALTNATKLRAVLDTVISADEKITTCKPEHYPALLAALEKAVAEAEEDNI